MAGIEHIRVEADEAGMRLDRWFKVHYPGLAFGSLQKLLRSGQVRVDGGRVKSDARVQPGQTVRIPPLEVDAKKAGIEDNDWIECFNANGALTARAVVSQRVMEGMVMMYHAQERIVNVPGSETTKTRGGHHNSVTRVVLKPTHMIGGYAQQAYGFNYYGTVGCNRDEFVVVRKMAKVDWLDGPNGNDLPQPLPQDI